VRASLWVPYWTNLRLIKVEPLWRLPLAYLPSLEVASFVSVICTKRSAPNKDHISTGSQLDQSDPAGFTREKIDHLYDVVFMSHYYKFFILDFKIWMNFSYSNNVSYILIYNRYIYNFKFLIYTGSNRTNYWPIGWTTDLLTHYHNRVNDLAEFHNYALDSMECCMIHWLWLVDVTWLLNVAWIVWVVWSWMFECHHWDYNITDDDTAETRVDDDYIADIIDAQRVLRLLANVPIVVMGFTFIKDFLSIRTRVYLIHLDKGYQFNSYIQT